MRGGFHGGSGGGGGGPGGYNQMGGGGGAPQGGDGRQLYISNVSALSVANPRTVQY